MSSGPGVGTILPWEWSNNEPGPAPYEYQVPGSLEVQPYTATATFDGAGASADFIPVVSLYSQTGALLARVFPTSTIKEGDSAVVTWLPPFGSAASSPAPSGGAGFQFNAGTYGADNVGDYSLVEATALIPVLFSQPNVSDGDEETGSLAVNAKYGFVVTCAPGVPGPALTAVYHGDSGGNGAAALGLDATETNGAGAIGINVTATAEGPDAAESIVTQGIQQRGGAGDAFGIQGLASNLGSGREVAGQFQAGGNQTGAASCAIEALDNADNPIFQVRNDGTVHIKTGTTVIADL